MGIKKKKKVIRIISTNHAPSIKIIQNRNIFTVPILWCPIPIAQNNKSSNLSLVRFASIQGLLVSKNVGNYCQKCWQYIFCVVFKKQLETFFKKV